MQFQFLDNQEGHHRKDTGCRHDARFRPCIYGDPQDEEENRLMEFRFCSLNLPRNVYLHLYYFLWELMKNS